MWRLCPGDGVRGSPGGMEMLRPVDVVPPQMGMLSRGGGPGDGVCGPMGSR